MNTNLHPKIQELKNQWNEEQMQGVVITDYEKLYYFNLLYAEACSRFHYLENCRKEMKDRLYLEFKIMEMQKQIKWQKQWQELLLSIKNFLKKYELLKNIICSCVLKLANCREKSKLKKAHKFHKILKNEFQCKVAREGIN